MSDYLPEHDRERGGNRALYLVAALFTAWAVGFILRSSFVNFDGIRRFCLFDDAMISMRYAWNLVHGAGLVWNPGERVEGVTNLFMVLLMSPAVWVAGLEKSVLIMQLLGIPILLLIAYFSMRLGLDIIDDPEFERRNPQVRSALFACGLCYYPLLYWTLMGMEIGLLTLFVVVSTYMVTHFRGSDRFLPSLPILMGLAIMTRPDALICAFVLMAYRALYMLHRPNGRKVLVLESALLILFPLGIAIFRWCYFGEFVPNTYALKVSGIPLAYRIENGLAYALIVMQSVSIPLVLAVMASIRQFRSVGGLILALFGVQLAYEISVGGDAWIFPRFTVPTIPLLQVFCMAELARILSPLLPTEDGGPYGEKVENPRRLTPRGRMWLIATMVLVIVSNWPFIGRLSLISMYDAKRNKEMVDMGIALRKVCKPSATIAVARAGALPYYSGLRAIDMLGKCDKHVALLPPILETPFLPPVYGMKYVSGHCKYDLDYSIKQLAPTFLERVLFGRQDLTAFVQHHYQLASYRGVNLWLKRNDPQVRWDMLDNPAASGKQGK